MIFPRLGQLVVLTLLLALPLPAQRWASAWRRVALGLAVRLAVSNTRHLSKADMKLNDRLPKIEVDSETYEVRADGELLTCEPATILPLAQRYFLF